jgi:hypothetical protein
MATKKAPTPTKNKAMKCGMTNNHLIRGSHRFSSDGKVISNPAG